MTIEEKISEKVEELAAIEHQRWSDWQAYCHKVLRENCPSPELEKVLERWDRQIATHYAELSEREKESDREQVRRYLPIVHDIARQVREEVNEDSYIRGFAPAKVLLDHVRSQIHTACKSRIEKEDVEARCCYCVPHEGCEFSECRKHNPPAPKGESWEEEIQWLNPEGTFERKTEPNGETSYVWCMDKIADFVRRQKEKSYQEGFIAGSDATGRQAEEIMACKEEIMADKVEEARREEREK